MKRLLCIGHDLRLEYWFSDCWYDSTQDMLKTSRGDLIAFRLFHTMILYEATNNVYYKTTIV